MMFLSLLFILHFRIGFSLYFQRIFVIKCSLYYQRKAARLQKYSDTCFACGKQVAATYFTKNKTRKNVWSNGSINTSNC